MKRMIAVFLVLFMIIGLTVSLYASDFVVSDYTNPFTGEAYTEDCFYGNGTIIIILSHEASIEWREYAVEDFPELELESVDTKLPASTDKEFILGNHEYRHFVHITLKDKSNEAVIGAIEILYKRYENNYTSAYPEKDIHLAIPMSKTYYDQPDIFENWEDRRPIDEIYGDVNGDEIVNLSDASLVLKHIAGWKNLVIDVVVADVNRDDKVNLADVSFILKVIAGWKNIL